MRAGWPFAATVLVPDVSATRPLGGATLRYTAQRIALSLHPAAPTVLEIEPSGPQTIQAGPGAAFSLATATAKLLVPLDGRGPATLTATAVSLLTEKGEGAEAGTLQMQWDTTVLDATIDALTPRPHLAAPFDGGAALTLHATTNQPFVQAETPAQSARAWQMAGGQVDVPSLTLRWGPVQAQGHGTWTLDTALQPAGRAVLQASGVDAVIDAAVRSGQLQGGPASAAKAVLSLMTLAAGGGAPIVPVQLQDRTLTIANFPVLRLPQLVWSAP